MCFDEYGLICSINVNGCVWWHACTRIEILSSVSSCCYIPVYTTQGSQMYVNPPPGPNQGQSEVDPGSMGQMDVSYGAYGGGGYDGGDTFEEEQPLLKELGVDIDLIKQKVSGENN